MEGHGPPMAVTYRWLIPTLAVLVAAGVMIVLVRAVFPGGSVLVPVALAVAAGLWIGVRTRRRERRLAARRR
jgi:Flp pilus assembly protein TadB